jgi:G3E family GTPase
VKLFLIGGFLGSGKTTAILGAARQLIAQGKRVGVITNDQGKYLVDTAFFAAASVPAVEVTGGCFCCNYDDLDSRLNELVESTHPDAIFAESVGSCADIVATVVNPLRRLRATASGFSVLVDSRLLLMRLRGQPLPFADEVVYVFDKQIEETGLLVINKTDLLSPDAVREVAALAQGRFPGKRLHLQDARIDEHIRQWMALAESASGNALAALDNERYGAGEAALAWLDEEIHIQLAGARGQTVLSDLLETLMAELDRQSATIGHIKVLADDGHETAKISVTTVSDPAWRSQIPDFQGSDLTLALNARVQMAAASLLASVENSLAHITALHGVRCDESRQQSFRPAMPRPTHPGPRD